MVVRLPDRYVRRPALVERLALPAEVVALVGPQGSGKSLLLREWASARNDVVDAHCGIRGPAGPSERFLIIDDAHRLTPDEWHELQQVRYRWRGIRLATTSARALPDELQAELVDDLAFTAAQTSELLARYGAPTDPALVQSLTDGLPYAVAVLARDGGRDRELLAARLAAAGSVLPAELARLAVHPDLDRGMVRSLGLDDAVLDTAERAGWGGWRSTQRGRRFRLTATVREATRAERPVAATVARRLHTRAADYLFAQQDWQPAFAEALLAEHYELADAVLKRAGLAATEGRALEIRAALEGAPRQVLRRYPALAFLLALILYARQETSPRATELLGVSVLGARNAPAYAPDRAVVRVVESVASRLAGTGDGGTRAALSAAEILTGLSTQERQQLSGLLPTVHAHLGVSLLYGEQFDEARRQFTLSLADPRQPLNELFSWGSLATIEALGGDLDRAEKWIDLARTRPWPDAAIRGYSGTMLAIASTLVALETLDFERAARELEVSWHDIATNEHWPLLLHCRALLDIGTGGAGEGLERFRLVRAQRTEQTGVPPKTEERLTLTEHLLALAAGELTLAGSLLGKARGVQLQLAAVRWALIADDGDRALELLVQAVPQTPSDRLTATILRALLLLRLDRAEEAQNLALTVRAQVNAGGRRLPLLFIPADGRELFGGLLTGVPQAIGATKPLPALSRRERVVLRELLSRATQQEIAARLQVSENTVKSQRRSLYRKLGVSTREDAIAAALVHGLLPAL